MSMLIQKDKLLKLLGEIIKEGQRVVAPVDLQGVRLFSEIKTADDISWDGINTQLSIKGYFLPRSEPILKFRVMQKQVEAQTILSENIRSTVIFGVHPCDAASLPIMDRLYNWDYKDEYWNQRRTATTLIALSCLSCDDACFCTSLGLDPGSTKGADVLLTPLADEQFFAEVITTKGATLVERYKHYFNEGDAEKDKVLKPVREKLGKQFELANIQPWLKDNFYNEFWERETLYCVGCGICTFVCPTCHCFDIVDEGTLYAGRRMKFWDACQFRTYTLHASGHNPRTRQDERHRQRIQHKFNYYLEKFDETLCVGCGRCIRYCPVDLSILRLLKMISQMQSARIG